MQEGEIHHTNPDWVIVFGKKKSHHDKAALNHLSQLVDQYLPRYASSPKGSDERSEIITEIIRIVVHENHGAFQRRRADGAIVPEPSIRRNLQNRFLDRIRHMSDEQKNQMIRSFQESTNDETCIIIWKDLSLCGEPIHDCVIAFRPNEMPSTTRADREVRRDDDSGTTIHHASRNQQGQSCRTEPNRTIPSSEDHKISPTSAERNENGAATINSAVFAHDKVQLSPPPGFQIEQVHVTMVCQGCHQVFRIHIEDIPDFQPCPICCGEHPEKNGATADNSSASHQTEEMSNMGTQSKLSSGAPCRINQAVCLDDSDLHNLLAKASLLARDAAAPAASHHSASAGAHCGFSASPPNVPGNNLCPPESSAKSTFNSNDSLVGHRDGMQRVHRLIDARMVQYLESPMKALDAISNTSRLSIVQNVTEILKQKGGTFLLQGKVGGVWSAATDRAAQCVVAYLFLVRSRRRRVLARAPFSVPPDAFETRAENKSERSLPSIDNRASGTSGQSTQNVPPNPSESTRLTTDSRLSLLADAVMANSLDSKEYRQIESLEGVKSGNEFPLASLVSAGDGAASPLASGDDRDRFSIGYTRHAVAVKRRRSHRSELSLASMREPRNVRPKTPPESSC